MKKLSLITITLLVLLSSCNTANKEQKKDNSQENTKPEFQTILDSSNVKGSILIYDLQQDLYYSNDFSWAKTGRLPASTFKITNSIIALETGVIENDSTLLKWNGEKRAFKLWEQDLIFRDAFHFSCVPCYQEIARKIGTQRMTEHLDKFNYGRMDVDTSNIDLFWLEGDSKISQVEQIDFLKRFYLSKLPITERTENIMKTFMVIEKNEDYQISGKTGWAIRDGKNNGWFVGYLETKDKVFFFATNIEPKEGFNMDQFPRIRKRVSYQAFKQLGLIKK